MMNSYDIITALDAVAYANADMRHGSRLPQGETQFMKTISFRFQRFLMGGGLGCFHAAMKAGRIRRGGQSHQSIQ
jgi:hypothetical protein